MQGDRAGALFLFSPRFFLFLHALGLGPPGDPMQLKKDSVTIKIELFRKLFMFVLERTRDVKGSRVQVSYVSVCWP